MARRLNPYAFTWEVREIGEEDHLELDVECPVFVDNLDGPLSWMTLAQARQTRVRAAGLLARLGWAVADELRAQQREHGCGSWQLPGCEVQSRGGVGVRSILDVHDDWGSPIGLYLTIRRGRGNAWRRRVREVLEEFVEQEQPESADAFRWSELPDLPADDEPPAPAGGPALSLIHRRSA
ncbi:hypothetical protein [Kineococcus rhizosphaerae]|uniref:Uncharacterized protein n=1 Tax=Kineococcus rhizosphaerae TaxID=559628 RepID=A0A2T0QNB1_9ACTN|nr:hypothetical protein [Kineococcus rhizosphaerae]PRY06090.1 hypothetical protein CLV37_1355 [Kineococcus rhizosphaerae]